MSTGAKNKPKLRVVLDTNVIVSAICTPFGIPWEVYEAVSEHHWLLLSDALVGEVESVILRKKFDRYLSRKNRRQAVRDLEDVGTYVAVRSELAVITDAKDNKVLALAVDGRADYIVTGNTKHFRVPRVLEKYPNLEGVTHT